MNIERLPEPIDALVITNSLDIRKRDNTFAELQHLLEDGSSSGAWLNEKFDDLTDSAISNNIIDTVFNPEILDSINQVNPMYRLLNNVNNHSMVINYYGHAQSSPMRYDSAAFISKTFFHSNPKNFSGGSLTVQIGSEIAYEADVEDNQTIIFPGFYYHEVSDVRIDDKEIANSGLYCVTTYFFITP